MTPRKPPYEKEIFALVRRLFPKAPAIGSITRIFLGVGKTRGRVHNTQVKGLDDIARRALVVGYTLRAGDAARRRREDFGDRGIMIAVEPLGKCKLVPKFTEAHIDCLEEYDAT